MKKLLILMLMLCLLLCGCSQNPENPTSTGGNAMSSEPETVTIYVCVSQHMELTFDGETQITDYTYILDENDRITSCTYTDAEGSVQGQLTIEYDENGRESKQTMTLDSDESAMSTTYDDQGRIIEQEVITNGELMQHYTYTYGDTDQPLTMELVNYSAQLTYRYEYAYEGERKTQETYYQNGELSYITVYEYDDEDRITKTVTQLPDGAVTSESSYTYSEDGLTCTIVSPIQTQIQVRDEHGNLLSNTVESDYMTQVTTYEYKAVEVPADDPRAK